MGKLTTVFCLLMLLSSTACQLLSPPTPQNLLVGKWEAVDVSGNDGGMILGIHFTFRGNGIFSTTTEIAGGVFDTRAGRYHLAGDEVELTFNRLGVQKPQVEVMGYEFQDGMLKLSNKRGKNWMKLVKIN